MSLLLIQLAVKYVQLRMVERMKAIIWEHQYRNLANFEKTLKNYQDSKLPFAFSFIFLALIIMSHVELSSDLTMCSHLAALYDSLLEQNLLQIVEPYFDRADKPLRVQVQNLFRPLNRLFLFLKYKIK